MSTDNASLDKILLFKDSLFYTRDIIQFDILYQVQNLIADWIHSKLFNLLTRKENSSQENKKWHKIFIRYRDTIIGLGILT